MVGTVLMASCYKSDEMPPPIFRPYAKLTYQSDDFSFSCKSWEQGNACNSPSILLLVLPLIARL